MIFHSYVSLPEGNHQTTLALNLVWWLVGYYPHKISQGIPIKSLVVHSFKVYVKHQKQKRRFHGLFQDTSFAGAAEAVGLLRRESFCFNVHPVLGNSWTKWWFHAGKFIQLWMFNGCSWIFQHLWFSEGSPCHANPIPRSFFEVTPE